MGRGIANTACSDTTVKGHIALSSRHRQAISAVVVLAVAAALLLGAMLPAIAGTQATAAPGLTEEQKIVHLLNRIGYGPRPGDVERVKRVGLNAYIDEQLHPETIDDSASEARLTGLASLRMTIAEISEKYPEPQMVARTLGLSAPVEAIQQAMRAESRGMQDDPRSDDPETTRQRRETREQIRAYYAEHGLQPPQRLLQELQAQKLIRAVHSERQLLEVMGDFWFNHFNVFWGKGADRRLTTDFDMHAIRPHALGMFKDLLLATAKSPAMLFYLDNFLSSSPDAKMPDRAARNSLQPREPFANELRKRQPGINENYARELMELHTLGVDGGYTQRDVQEVARCFTGWTIERPRQDAKFVFRDWMHDTGEKVVLGHKIPAGGGIGDGEMVLAILAQHPSTARFIATKLARRFVSDNPPQALIDRVTAVYLRTDGSIREMLRTIFTSPEFYAPEVYRAKIKSPLELGASAIRALNGNTDGSPRLAQFVAKMGQPLYRYQAPTGFPDRAEQWVNTGALLERLNFGLALSASRIPGTTIDLTRVTSGIDPTQGNRLMERAVAVLLHGDVSPQTRAALDRQLTEDPPSSPVGPPVDRLVAKAVGLVLGSPEFQRR